MKVSDYDCKPLHFFRKLPPQMKVEVDEIVVDCFEESVITTMQKEGYLLETLYLLLPLRKKVK